MTRWEYTTVGEPMIRGGGAFVQSLNLHGEQGWELVTADYVNGNFMCLMKRPIEEAHAA